jgi:hypothetical protein
MDPLANPDRLLEQGIENRADSLVILAQRQGVLDLPENLALSDDKRIQTRCDRKSMGDRSLIEEHRAQ